MRKFEIDHLKARVKDVVQCTNGTISTTLNKAKKSGELTDLEKFHMIRHGQAQLRSDVELLQEHKWSRSFDTLAEQLTECFMYPETEAQKEVTKHNLRIDARITDLHTQVELAGQQLIDEAVLGLVELATIPERLHALGEMVRLADI